MNLYYTELADLAQSLMPNNKKQIYNLYKEMIPKRKTYFRYIKAKKSTKNKELIGQGNYDHKNDSTLASGHTSTEEFAKITGIGSKEYVSMLLKRGLSPIKNHDKRV